jgi:hypothetical protein
MSCNLTYGIPLDCIDSIAGISGSVYISSNADLGTLTLSSSAGTESLVTGATGESGAFYEFQIAKNVGSFTETFNISNENGTAFFEQALTLNLQKMEASKRNELLLIARNRNLKVFFTDNNGNAFLMGYSRGAVVSAGTSVSGQAVGDLNGYTLTLTAQEPAMAFQVQAPIATTFSGCTFNAAP